AATLAGLRKRPCRTRDLPIHGYDPDASRFGDLAMYGSDAPAIRAQLEADAGLGERLHPALPYIAAEVIWSVPEGFARTGADVLPRRLGALFLTSAAAVEMAPRVATLMARELRRDAVWTAAQVKAFTELAQGYRI